MVLIDYRGAKYAQLATSFVGSDSMRAPEITAGQVYTNKSDVYSFGLVIFEIVFTAYIKNRIDFTKNARNVCKEKKLEDDEKIKNFQLFIYCKHLASIVNQMISEDEKKRPTMEEVMNFIQQEKKKIIKSEYEHAK